MFQKFQSLQTERIFLEKKYDIFSPYINYTVLNTDWRDIIKKCVSLQYLNIENKKMLNEKFYINQYFLELLSSSSKDITYDSNGNLQW